MVSGRFSSDYVEAWKHHPLGRPSRSCMVRDVMRATCLYYGIEHKDLISHRKPASLVLARQVAMFLSVELTDRSLPQIGHAMNRDHTTVLWGVRKIHYALTYPERRDPNGTLASDVASIRLMVEEICQQKRRERERAHGND